jgi:ComF family protein
MRERYHGLCRIRGETPLVSSGCQWQFTGMKIARAIAAIDQAIMPLRCAFCGTRAGHGNRFICGGCRTDLPWNGSPVASEPGLLRREVAPLAYAFPIDAAIKALKYQRKLFYGPALAEALCAACDRLPGDVDTVMPVPLHWRRKWWRGFNQALELARPVARHLGVPIIHVVTRTRFTPSQARLNAPDRVRNLRAAFRLRRPLTCRHVLLVDDVITTGSTLQELARVLLDGGAEHVSGLAVARA